jgi:hypothetical protein
MWFRICTYFEFANIPKVLLKYREQANNATNSKMKEILKETVNIRMKNFSNKAYRLKLLDRIANYITTLMIVLPENLVVKVFKVLRRLFT